jgi:hypothetical protein
LAYGRKNGKGKYRQFYFINGRLFMIEEYIGEFRNDKKDGKGELIVDNALSFSLEKGKFEYTGSFKDDKMHGKGKYVGENGVRCDTEWSEGRLLFSEPEKQEGNDINNSRR